MEHKVDANWIKLYSDGGMERWDNQKTKQWKWDMKNFDCPGLKQEAKEN